jgi:peptide-methionine (R)-S-oxide reductase
MVAVPLVYSLKTAKCPSWCPRRKKRRPAPTKLKSHNPFTKGNLMMTRRNTLLGAGALTATLTGVVAGLRGLFASSPAEAAQAARTFAVTHTEAEWKKLLDSEQFRVLRQAGTERPGSSPLNKEKRAGVFTCAGCALPLFSSTTKFESGTGWPSFWQPLDKAVVEDTDTTLFMKRVEVLCRQCGGHLGHVFNDGPKPTGLRYCMNGVALNFKAA